MSDVLFGAEICKVDEDQRIVYGYASVVEKGGTQVVDLHNHVIDEDDIVNAAHDFMKYSRQGHEMHAGEIKGEIVESLVLTKTVQKALGIDLGMVGWFIGYKVYDEATWQEVKKGNLKAFSFGGKGNLEDLD